MKKILMLVSVLSIFLLTGCFGQSQCFRSPNLESCKITYTPITGDTTGEIQNDEVLNIFYTTEDYVFSYDALSIFTFSENEGIPYVDVEEFLFVMHECLNYYIITIDGTVTIRYQVNYSGTFFGGYEFLMELDPIENTIYFNDLNFTSEFNTTPNLDHESNLRVVSGDYIDGNLEATIDLDDYNIKMKEEDGALFIPLYLANVLLTGSYMNVYQNGQTLYIVDDFTLANDFLVDESMAAPDVDVSNLIENSANFTAMYFDYFYGLKSYFGVDSYKDLFESIGLYDAQTLAEFDEILFSFIFSLTDLHTSIFSLGYDSDQAQFSYPEDNQKLTRFYEAYYSDTCEVRSNEFSFREYEFYYIMEINEFTMDTLSYLQTNLVHLDESKPIFIDLACNPGGSLLSVLELMAFMTDKPFEFKYEITATGEIYKQTYISTNETPINNTFYLFTSNASFSAANLFVSMVKDNHLATVIGNDTSGGACAVVFAVLPNNMIITHSSYMAMLNENDEIIEEGVSPDYYYTDSVDIVDLISFAENYYFSEVGRNIEDNTLNNVVDFTITSGVFTEDATLVNYEVVVSSVETNEVLNTVTYTSNSFNYHSVLSITGPMVSIIVYAHYEYLGMIVTVPIYESAVDPSSQQ